MKLSLEISTVKPSSPSPTIARREDLMKTSMDCYGSTPQNHSHSKVWKKSEYIRLWNKSIKYQGNVLISIRHMKPLKGSHILTPVFLTVALMS